MAVFQWGPRAMRQVVKDQAPYSSNMPYVVISDLWLQKTLLVVLVY